VARQDAPAAPGNHTAQSVRNGPGTTVYFLRENKKLLINPAALGCLPVFDGPTVLTKTGGSLKGN